MQNSVLTQETRDLKRVLLVEAPSQDRERHERLLTKHKYTVTVVDDVEAVSSVWIPRSFGLVLFSLNGTGNAAAQLCDTVRESDPDQLIAMIFHPDQELPATECPTLIFTTEPDEYFLARVETLTEMAYAA